MNTWLGVRVSEKGRPVERITLKIKMYDTGKWEWTVRQRFIREPRIKLQDMLTIIDEVKAEIIASEEEQQNEKVNEESIPTSSSKPS
jgi:hypothetical protein